MLSRAAVQMETPMRSMFRRMPGREAAVLSVLAVSCAVGAWFVHSAIGATTKHDPAASPVDLDRLGELVRKPIPAGSIDERTLTRRLPQRLAAAQSSGDQILFGDLHVHTT